MDRCPFADEDIKNLRQAVVDDMCKMGVSCRVNLRSTLNCC